MALEPSDDDAIRAPGEVTRILQRLSGGRAPDAADAERLMELAHGELRRLAGGFLASERVDHTLQPTALVNEAWLRLADQTRVEWRGRAHFMAIAAQAMRRILLDHARAKHSAKRGGGWRVVELDTGMTGPEADQGLDLIALDEALGKLGALSPTQARLVELRFFGGLAMDDVAEVLGVSVRTAEREWRFAKAWLLRELRGRD
ncbi:MAG TPA: sigma-70 family RNA polymerase sigma factor [Planctomycetota bacterium]|nr:sigma-70 family RNA polymerase sigma factor [Planctomycetota bacterium]